jgi:hypothetical protein
MIEKLTEYHHLGQNTERWPYKQSAKREPHFYRWKICISEDGATAQKSIPTSEKCAEGISSGEPPIEFLPIYPGLTGAFV